MRVLTIALCLLATPALADAAGAAQVLGVDHGVTKALAKASTAPERHHLEGLFLGVKQT